MQRVDRGKRVRFLPDDDDDDDGGSDRTRLILLIVAYHQKLKACRKRGSLQLFPTVAGMWWWGGGASSLGVRDLGEGVVDEQFRCVKGYVDDGTLLPFVVFGVSSYINNNMLRSFRVWIDTWWKR